MSISTIVGLALTVTTTVLLLKEFKPEFAVLVSTVFGIIVVASLYLPVKEIIATVYSVAEVSGIGSDALSPILKTVGISFICEFATSACIDAGQEQIASRVEQAGKITVLTLALPMITQMLNTVLSLLK